MEIDGTKYVGQGNDKIVSIVPNVGTDVIGRNMDQRKQEWQDFEKLEVNIIDLDNPVLNTEGKTDLERKLIRNIIFELLTYVDQNNVKK